MKEGDLTLNAFYPTWITCFYMISLILLSFCYLTYLTHHLYCRFYFRKACMLLKTIWLLPYIKRTFMLLYYTKGNSLCYYYSKIIVLIFRNKPCNGIPWTSITAKSVGALTQICCFHLFHVLNQRIVLCKYCFIYMSMIILQFQIMVKINFTN